MSGTFYSRVNRFWDLLSSNVSMVRFFWEFLHFINDHANLSVVQVGTNTTSHGSIIPPEWLSWDGIDDPTTLSPIPLNPNSWIVFRADNASPLFNGSGTMKWEVKIQVTFDSITYLDPSGTDYGANGDYDVVIFRSSAAGGWTGIPTWDFAPSGGEDCSEDQIAFDDNSENNNYYLDIIGDNDTIFWRGSAGNFPTFPPKNYSRSGYIGLLQRRSDDIAYPFLMMIGRISSNAASSGLNAINSRNNSSSYEWAWGTETSWPSYTIGSDGSRITNHQLHIWQTSRQEEMSSYKYGSNDEIIPQIMIRESQSLNNYSILGELRFLVMTNTSKLHSDVFGENLDIIEICCDPETYGGIGMRWPYAVVPIW